MSSEAPVASLIIPTRNRADSLERFLPALAEQKLDEPYEVLIVDNSSTDHTPTVIQNAIRRWPHIRCIREAKPWPARNAGAFAARSPILIFVDDDMQTDEDFIAEHLRLHRESPGGVVLGNIVSAPGRRPFDRMMAYIYDGPRQTLAHREPTGTDVWSGNLSLSRDLYFKFGGYSDEMSDLSCQDMEFGLRLAAAGVSMRFAPRALTYHYFQSEKFPGRLERSYVVGVGLAFLQERYPDLQADIAPLTHSRWRAHLVEFGCRVFARAIEPFDRGAGVPCVPLAYVYALGIKTATTRGIADYRAGRAAFKGGLLKFSGSPSGEPSAAIVGHP
jgi:GT2 family glycosyltransferase